MSSFLIIKNIAARLNLTLNKLIPSTRDNQIREKSYLKDVGVDEQATLVGS